jgi:hypothetical protein
MNRDDDKRVIGIWLDCYNNLSRADFRVDSCPDEDDRSSKSIDALCKDSTGRTLGLEHTRIEAFPGEMNDNRRFLDVLGTLERNSSLAGSFLVGRSWPAKTNEPTVRKAFEDKLPKLRASNADIKILLLEQNSVAGSIRSDIHEYFEANGVPDWMPDEMWVLWTPVLDAENYMHVSELYPDLRNLKADWTGGNIAIKYP